MTHSRHQQDNIYISKSGFLPFLRHSRCFDYLQKSKHQCLLKPPPPMILFALLQDSAVSTSSLLSSFFFYVIQPLLVPCSPTSPVVFVSPLSVLSSFLLSVSPLFSSASFASFICYFSFFFVWSCSFSFFGFFIVLSAFPLSFSSSAAVLW